MDCRLGDVQTNLNRIEESARKISKHEPDIVCFPELVTTGYSLEEKWVQLAEPVTGQACERIGRIARENGFYIILGMPEQDAQTNRTHNSALILEPNGDCVGVYRKVHLWDRERIYFSPGNRFDVFETKFGRIGIGICYDLEFPEPARVMALAGAEVIFFPSAEMKPFDEQVDIFLKSRASENGVFIAFSNRYGHEGKTTFFGKSQVVSPSGRTLVSAVGPRGYAVSRVRTETIEAQREKLPYLKQRMP